MPPAGRTQDSPPPSPPPRGLPSGSNTAIDAAGQRT